MEYMATLELINEKINELAIMMARGFSELRDDLRNEMNAGFDRIDSRVDGLEKRLDVRIDLLQEQCDTNSTRLKDIELIVLAQN